MQTDPMRDSCPIVDKQMKILTRNIALGKKSLTNQLQKAMRPKKTYETKDEHENINHFTQHGNVFFKEQSYHERARDATLFRSEEPERATFLQKVAEAGVRYISVKSSGSALLFCQK